MNYIVIKATPIYDNNGKPVTNWQVGKTFTTGGYIKNGMLYLGTNGENVNRWIPVGTYKLVDVVTPPPPVTVERYRNIRTFASDRITVLENTWWKEVVE